MVKLFFTALFCSLNLIKNPQINIVLDTSIVSLRIYHTAVILKYQDTAQPYYIHS